MVTVFTFLFGEVATGACVSVDNGLLPSSPTPSRVFPKPEQQQQQYFIRPSFATNTTDSTASHQAFIYHQHNRQHSDNQRKNNTKMYENSTTVTTQGNQHRTAGMRRFLVLPREPGRYLFRCCRTPPPGLAHHIKQWHIPA